MSLTPGAVPFADLTPEDVGRADEVHALDPLDDEYLLVLPVGRADRSPDDTLRLLLVSLDHSWRDMQEAFVRTMVLAAAHAAARCQPPTRGVVPIPRQPKVEHGPW
jgi:hypothetical protein